MKISDVVQRRIDDERSSLADYVSNLPEDCSNRRNKLLLQEFWPEIKKGAIFTRTTNLAVGWRAIDVIPYYDAPIVDIRADSDDPEREFFQRTGMSFESAIPFAKERLIVPIIYHSAPKEWLGFEEKVNNPSKFKELIYLSYLHKDRMNAFCQKKDANHKSVELDVLEHLRALPPVDEMMKFSPTHSLDKRGERAFIAIAQRIAYLHTFSPDDYEEAMNKLEAVKSGSISLQALSDFVHLKKWLNCSAITASIGGFFNISDTMADRVNDVLRDENLSRSAPALGDRESQIAEWISRRIMGAFKIEIFQVQHVDRMVDFLASPANFSLRLKIMDEIENLYSLLYSDVEDEALVRSVTEIEELVGTYRENAVSVDRLLGGTSNAVDHTRHAAMGMGSAPIFNAIEGILVTLEFLGPTKYVVKHVLSPSMKKVAVDALLKKKLGSANALRALQFDQRIAPSRG